MLIYTYVFFKHNAEERAVCVYIFQHSPLILHMSPWELIFTMAIPLCRHWNKSIVDEYLGCCVQLLHHVQLFATLWTVPLQAPLSMGLSQQQYWSGLPFPPPGDLPAPGIKPTSTVAPVLAGRFFTSVPPGEPPR